MTTVTINDQTVTIPEGMTMTVTPEGSMTFTMTSVPEAPAKTDRKVRSANSRTGFAGNVEEFGELLGVNLEGWTLQDVLDSLREYTAVGTLGFYPDGVGESDEVLVGMPEGWTFGPSAMNYLTKGEWLTS